MSESVISVEYKGRVAIITIQNEPKLNALNQAGYYELAEKLREVADHDEVYITLLTGKGRFFSAGADVTITSGTPGSAAAGLSGPGSSEVRKFWLSNFVAFNLNITEAFSRHPKILVVGLNGPVIGLSAALVAFADFIYCTPSTFLLTPFSSLGLVAEGGSSRALVQRLGVSKANEALIMSKRISADELLATGFVNKVISGCGEGKGADANFRELVLREIDERLGDHLVGNSLIGIKALIRRPELEIVSQQNVGEVLEGLNRFVSGVPQAEFMKLASGQKRHKL